MVDAMARRSPTLSILLLSVLHRMRSQTDSAWSRRCWDWSSAVQAMDLETASAIESLRNDLDRSTTDLADRILAVETSLGRKLATTEDALRAEMRQVRDEITRDLRAEMGQVRDEVTRNAAVLTESVRGDVRTVADGLATVSAQLVAVGAKIDALNR
jgi:hypothetical protein